MDQDKHTSDGDLSEMLVELRILLLGSQLLSAFLVTIPFSSGFAKINQAEKYVFMATFLSCLLSLILFTAPAIQHRLVRPLNNRPKFKEIATRQILAGSFCLSVSLVLAVDLVASEVIGHQLGLVAAGFFAVAIGILWWLMPRVLKKYLSL